MLKVLINEEEVVSNQNFTINQHMLNTPSVILNNVVPKSWCESRDYTSSFYHPQDYSKCKILDITDIPYDPGSTIEGTTFTIPNNDNNKLHELTTLKGNTTQASTPTPDNPVPVNVVSGGQEIDVVGKNLLDISDITSGNGITNNGNGTITLNGTITSTSFTLKKPFILKANTTYTMSLTNTYSSGANSTFILRNDNTNIFSIKYNVASRNYTSTQDVVIDTLRIYGDNVNFNDYTFSIQLEESATPTSYEEYKGQSYEINLGKNLFNKDNVVENKRLDSSGQLYSDNSYITSQYIVVSPSTDYTYSRNDTGGGSSAICYYKQDKTFISRSMWGGSFESKKITTPNEAFYVRVCDIKNLDIQFEKGSQATSYSSYKTPIELCKIGDYQDFIRKGTGKNLFDKDNANIYLGYVNISNVIKDEPGTTSIYIPCLPNTTYTMSKRGGSVFSIAYCENVPVNNGIAGGRILDNTATSLTITTGSNAHYLIASICATNDTNKQNVINSIQIELGSQPTLYEPYGYKDKWYLYKTIFIFDKDNLDDFTINKRNDGDGTNTITFNIKYTDMTLTGSQYYKCNRFQRSQTSTSGIEGYGSAVSEKTVYLQVNRSRLSSLNVNGFKSYYKENNVKIYCPMDTPTTTEITDSELISQLEGIELLQGLNNVSVSSGDLSGIITIHYNYVNASHTEDLLFCGVVKNSGKISLNPREPHYSTLQILDFKDFLSSGETLDFVIYQKTILEAIQQVIGTIQDYGFVLGNINILNPTDIIGAYSTKDKTAYDVFNYIADITQSRWTTRMIDENYVAIDFYDPTLMPQGTQIDYTDTFFKNNLIDDMKYSYGTNNYRNKQVMISNQVYSNISQTQTIVANGYQTQFPTEQPIGKINSITSNGIPLTFATFNEKEMGYVADFYYKPGENYFESDDLRSIGEVIIIDYVAIVEGRQVITNSNEIERINESTGRKGIIARYETRNDATTSTELQKIGESYIKYKGTPEIKLTITARSNIWDIGQKVQFNAPINELNTEYMVRSKKINYIASTDTIFYTFELISSFNSETEINYFDNQRAKASGNIGEGEYISRNIDIESTAEIIFYDTTTTEVVPSGDNELNAILNSPFIS